VKSAFTMIELIFVIVILGILATVAIPRLSATRGDAVVSKLASNIMTAASEISAYAVSNSTVDSNFTIMSNAIRILEVNGDAIVTPNQATVKAGNISDCVTLSVDVNNTTGVDTLILDTGNANGDTLCVALQNAIDENKYPMKLRGSNVTY